MTAILALCMVLVCMTVGDLVAAKTKAFVPSVFVTACLFLLGFWYVFPKDTVQIANLSQPFAGMAMFLIVTHMGTMMNIKELAAQWKTVIISLAGIAGIIVILLTVGSLILGRETVLVGAPPLTGGIVAAILMQAAAKEAGMELLSILAILVYVAQGFVGYPLTAICLKKEGNRLIENYRNGKREVVITSATEQSGKELKIIPDLPEKYSSSNFTLLRLAFVAFLADIFTKMINANVFHNPKAISPLVTCLIFGVLATELGITEKKPLEKAGSFGWIILALMAFIFEGLSNATPDMLAKVIGPLLVVIAIGVVGLILFAFLAGKLLKESTFMALPIAFNALYGFPPNYILTKEAIKAITDDEVEQKYLEDVMMPKMLIGGFTSVTVASVLVAGIFAGML